MHAHLLQLYLLEAPPSSNTHTRADTRTHTHANTHTQVWGVGGGGVGPSIIESYDLLSPSSNKWSMLGTISVMGLSNDFVNNRDERGQRFGLRPGGKRVITHYC